MRIGIGFCLLLLCASQVLGIGYVYTGVGGGGRELLELTSVDVDVQIRDRVAVTRMDQVFSNRSDGTLEGIYEFALPSGAIVTDLVLWIDDRRVQGKILEREEARRTYDGVVRRRIDPALAEFVAEDRFRLSIFPFPPQGSRRVELEYSQVLAARDGEFTYRFPLAAETEREVLMQSFVLRARIGGQHAFSVEPEDRFALATAIDRRDDRFAEVLFADEFVAAESDFSLHITETEKERLPTVLSYAPRDGGQMGYYALWLPPLSELADSDPLPRSITFIVDISSSMRGAKLAAVKGALAAAIEDLQKGDLFNVVVFSTMAMSFADSPLPADADNKEAAVAFVQQQSALGVTNFEAALTLSLGQFFPEVRLNHLIFLTDGNPSRGETDLEALGRIVESLAQDIRLFTIGVGADVNRSFLRLLAADHRGTHSFLSAEGDIEEALRSLFAEFTRPIFLPQRILLRGIESHEIFPNGIDLLAAGQELFQVGRYVQGGAFTLHVEGQVLDSQLTIEYPLEFSAVDTSQSIIPRLWAHQKIQAIEGQLARVGQQAELLDDILDLGLSYHLVTRRTSLYAPDDDIVIDPEPEIDLFAGGATAVEEEVAIASWFGREFYLSDGIWYDTDYAPGTVVEVYRAAANQPGILRDFARLGRDLVVVLDNQAYSLARGVLPRQPVLLQNYPNPFNPETLIRYQLPAAGRVELVVYNLAGQRVRLLVAEDNLAGVQQVVWDGLTDRGDQAASGIYIYRLQAGGHVLSRRMLLVR